jgi:hypothetical protein
MNPCAGMLEYMSLKRCMFNFLFLDQEENLNIYQFIDSQPPQRICASKEGIRGM